MLGKLLRAGEGRTLRQLERISREVNAAEPRYQECTDAQLREQTEILRGRLSDGASLDDILVDAFAVAREASWRVLGQRHFDVQVMGGAALHLGNIAEMRTGEGKTLTCVLPAYLNALGGGGVHVVTVNDYLARRDGENMGRVHAFLGLEVGILLSSDEPAARRQAYACDITYGTNNEFGFDYLRDNMARTPADLVQRGHHYAIVDEVDSILVDEARTPLIISGPTGVSSSWYEELSRIVGAMRRDVHYEVDEKKRTVSILEAGVTFVEDELGSENLYEAENTVVVGYLGNALQAKELFRRDVEYVIVDGEVLIVDPFTGRTLAGRRYGEGLHQAIEAKEGVAIQDENQTLATITLQNYFRLYEKLAGMTGTAMTEAAEFAQIYNLGVLPIPTNRPMIREDGADAIFLEEDAKFATVVAEISRCHQAGQPVLVGTTSVEKSERLSALLDEASIPHNVLNAKQHEREAHIIAQAGRKGAVTVATNMAGRGTDIMLGGNAEFRAEDTLRGRGLDPQETPEEWAAAWLDALEAARTEVVSEHEEVVAAGGLYVIGTERHESRRIDNQLRGRCARQGDPGASKFYLSFGDELLLRFGGSIKSTIQRLNLPADVPLEARMATRAIQSAQTQVEAQNFEARKDVLKYDEVMDRQRRIIYEERRAVLEGQDLHEQVLRMIDEVLEEYVQAETSEGYPEDWDLAGLERSLRTVYPCTLSLEVLGEESGFSAEYLTNALQEDARAAYFQREEELGTDESGTPTLRELERRVVLHALDEKWREHLYEMDYLQAGIGLRAQGQRDPLVEYQREGYDLFVQMLAALKEEVVTLVFRATLQGPAETESTETESTETESTATGPTETGPTPENEALTGREPDRGEEAAASPEGSPAGDGGTNETSSRGADTASALAP